MPDPIRITALAALAFAAVSLAAQLVAAWGGGRREHSAPAGSPARGVLYNFTAAMSPLRKESARLYPLKFAAGAAMHAGAVIALLRAIAIVVAPGLAPPLPAAQAILFAAAGACGLALIVRRAADPDLRGMSSPEDYLAAAATVGLLAASALDAVGAIGRPAFLIAAAALLFYLPLGKLRHALFFFAARADYGRRLGHRGVYPPRGGKEREAA